MIYDEFLKDKCGFFMQRDRFNEKALSIYAWDYLISDMLYHKRISIRREVKYTEYQSHSLVTNSTPKLRRMMRRNA